ncbi:MAG: hypothetical protein IPM66_09840 [Acidobacteriota bacterium]|nr:MAG: hypothetical protein IPM66_09840 [Acidobacteriota bacterium]
MYRLATFALVAGLMFSCSAQSKNFAEGQGRVASSNKLDGVYEFVSESTVLTEPKNAAYNRAEPEWRGMWQFQNGYFTRILMKRRRDSFFDPQKREDFGFESFAGRYKMEGGKVRLVQDLAFHPFDVDRSALLEYRFDGDELIFTQTLQPYVEDLRNGTITTVLRRHSTGQNVR